MTTALPTRAEDIGNRVLKLIDSIHGRDDLAPAHIEQVTGIKVNFNPDDANEYGFGGDLTEDWVYNLVSLTETDGSKPSRLMFSFDDQTRAYADMTPICAMDFDDYAKAMTAAGFSSAPAYGKHQNILYWDFARDKVNVQVYIRGESDAKPTHSCVSKMIINA
ncbi:MAG: hypothetical protein E6Q88_06090 [Lysobacteraceae bacterium]|nr:MAG: hypothetical protein E6Q88_06090 [Xanthomonadaceae bacterium]